MPVGTVAVAVPLTALKTAVIVTAPPVPTAVAFPVELTLTAQEFELSQIEEAVTSFGVPPLSKVARAVICCDCPRPRVAVLGVTVKAVGESTKKPWQPTAKASDRSVVKAARSWSFRLVLNMI
jgi:hypothetical protein